MDPVILVLLVVFMGGMLLMSSRSRKKQQAQQDNLQNSLAVGDIVVMTSGVSGTIVDLEDERTLDLEIAPDVVTTWLRVAVREKLTATETVDALDPLESLDEGSAAEEIDPVTSPGAETPTTTAPTATTDAGTAPGSRDDAASPSLRKTGS